MILCRYSFRPLHTSARAVIILAVCGAAVVCAVFDHILNRKEDMHYLIGLRDDRAIQWIIFSQFSHAGKFTPSPLFVLYAPPPPTPVYPCTVREITTFPALLIWF